MRRNVPLPVGIDPQVSRGSAAVAFPARRVGGVAADDLGLAGAEGEVIDLAQRQQLRHAAVRIEGKRAIVAEERLAVGRDEEDATLGRKAAHQHVGAKPCHPPRGPPSAGIR